jgi:outer membrane protein assembly factor BamA
LIPNVNFVTKVYDYCGLKNTRCHNIFAASLTGIFTVLLLFSCNPAKYVPKDKHLLYSSKVKIIDKAVKRDAPKSYIKQKPNKKIFGWIRFHLGLYNLSNIKKDKGIHKFLRKIGEEPVIYDPYLKERSLNQLKIFMENKGYYNSMIYDSVYFNGKKASVVYYIDGGKPYTIRDIQYSIGDTSISNIYFTDTLNTFLKRGDLFDKDVVLQNERIRIERLLKTNGYYSFSREYVFFEADTNLTTRQVNLEVQIKNPVNVSTGVETTHKQYKVRELVISRMPDPLAENANEENDTIEAGKGIYLTDIENLKINPRSFVQFLYIQPGKLFNENSVEETYSHVSSLNLFKLVDVKFSELTDLPDTSKFIWLDCKIRLVPSSLQSYSTDLEGTNSSGNIGGAVNFNYQHINLFGNAEVLNMKFRGALESLTEKYSKTISRTEEFGVEANIRFPTFLIPVRTENFIKKYNPKTNLSLSYNYQKRPDFTRTVANVGFGYNWKETRHKEHIFRPLEINYVDIPNTSPSFDSIISGTYLESSYRPHLITVMAYSYIYNNQNIKKNQDFRYFRINAESAGNILSLFDSKFEIENDSAFSYNKVLGIQYSQYLRGDVEFKYYNYINPTNNTVYRFFAGLAYPYGNARAIPFEKRYFSGGANGLRGWQLRSLGPGSFSDDDTTRIRKFPNSTGDIKLEINFEYRFKLFWKLEGAFFMDAGNIWAIRKEDNRAGALFEWDKFYKEFAMDSGLGFRFDFSFFLVRTDIGMKLRDPSEPEGNRWIPGSRKFTRSDFVFNLGIGYPF